MTKALCYRCRDRRCEHCSYPHLHPKLYEEYFNDMKKRELRQKTKQLEKELSKEGLKIERDKIKELREIDLANKHLEATKLENSNLSKEYEMFKVMLIKEIKNKGLETMSKSMLDNSKCYFCGKKGCQVGLNYTFFCNKCFKELDWKVKNIHILYSADYDNEVLDYDIVLECNDKSLKLPSKYFENTKLDVKEQVVEALRQEGHNI